MRFLIILLLFSFAAWGQDEKVIEFKFSISGGMDPIVQFVIIKPDSISVGIANGISATNTVSNRITSAQIWTKLIKSASNYKLEDLKILDLCDHSYDYCQDSLITITTNKKTYHSNEFSNDAPKKKLEQLKQLLLAIKDNKD